MAFKILGVILDNEFTFEQHFCSISSFARKIGLLRKSFKVLGDQSVLQKCYIPFIYIVWSTAHQFVVLQQIFILDFCTLI